MNIKELKEALHPLERKTFPAIEDNVTKEHLIERTGLKEVEVTRALQWLENKEVIRTKQEIKEIIKLDSNGRRYLEEGLPEKRLLKLLENERTIKELENDMDKDELRISLGVLKNKAAITLDKGIVRRTEQGKNLLEKESLEEKFLKKLPMNIAELEDEDKHAYEQLKKRREIITVDIEKIKTVFLTKLGEQLKKEKIDDNFIDTLTQEMLKKDTWKGKKFRRYDVKINVPEISFGKRHFLNQAIEYTKKIWIELGFKEMKGQILQTSFWNFDALFTAQDHPVRDLQDTFYIKNPEFGKLPKRFVNNVKKVHEDGWNTGSKGWQYKWDEKEAKRNVLRTHTTVLSVQTIAKLREADLPAKFFSVGKCFRNETLSWKHLFEFNQTEGIVVDPDANFKNLLGYLKEFFRKVGYKDARFRPAYFPYTEMSVEIETYNPKRKTWMELGGAGILRPEVVKPLLGKDIPVLAWGPGLDRTIMQYYKINDIRDLYRNDIKQLKEMKMWIR